MTNPTQDQAIWKLEGAEKSKAVHEMFAEIAPAYDKHNAVMSLYLDKRWRAIASKVLNLKPGQKVLDICCGTGAFFDPLLAQVTSSGTVTGLDFCQPMLEIASKKYGNQVQLIQGDACNLPMPDQQFDAVTCGWGIRNVPDIDLAHKEAFRVLKSGGRFVSIDMAIPQNKLLKKVSQWIFLHLIVNFWKKKGYHKAGLYLPKSTQIFKTRHDLKISMESAGFIEVTWRNLLFGNICVHWGKKP